MEETLHPSSEMDSDSSDSDDELQTLETELSTNPTNYDTHLKYINALRKQGDLDKLRLARKAMADVYPLTPSMWQQWTNDEISLVTVSSGNYDAQIVTIEKLYERGVSDYFSVSLWIDYLNFVQKYVSSVVECSPTGISKARDLFERALTACGLHVSEGSKLWEAYRSYEETILSSTPEDLEARKKQVQRIRNIFHRHLSIPHWDLKSTLLSYKAWEAEHGTTLDVGGCDTDGISSLVASAYQKALDMLAVRVDFEEQIVKSDVPDTERLQSFMAYLKFEQSSGDPARVKSLYERAITEFPISVDLWIDYTSYLNETLKTDRTLRDIFNRATRNCPWVGELWVRFMLYLERCGGSENELSDVFERSLQCTFSTIDEYVDIYRTRVDGLRRRILFAKDLDHGLDFSLIRDTFQRACDYLSPQLQNTPSLLQLHRYWAHLEFNIGKDVTAARAVWESLLKNSGSMLEAWQSYISMETEMGHINEARSLYKRCYTKRFSGTGSEDICNSWILFEREFGTLGDLDHASRKVTPRLQQLQLYRIQQESNNICPSTDHKEESVKKSSLEKRKSTSDAHPNEEPPTKRQKDAKGNQKDKAHAKSSAKTSKRNDTATPVDIPQGEGDIKAKDPTPDKSKQYNDQCTAFVSNLNQQANYEDLKGFFSDVGGVLAVRILMDKYTKKSRGLAYVDFSDETHLEAAVAKNKQMLLGKKLSIARSDPKGKRKGAAGNKKSVEQDARVELKGKNTFAVPRTVRALGWSGTGTNKQTSSATAEGLEEKPKSNEEPRSLLLKKT